MRVRLRRFLLVLLILLGATGAAFLARDLWEQQKRELARRALDLLPEAAQWIRDFHRVKMVDGKKVWEVAAREAQYYEKEKMVLVRGPMVSFFTKDGQEVSLQSDEGKLFLDDRELERVELSGGIQVKVGGYSLKMDAAQYVRSEDAILAPGAVEITGPDFDIRGEGLRIGVADQRLNLTSKVHMTLRSAT